MRLVLVTDRDAAERYAAEWRDQHPAGQVLTAPHPSEWPFRYPLCPALPAGAVLLRAENIDDAFANAQTGGVQLVTTQRKYLELEWNSVLDRHGEAWLVVTEGTSDAVAHPLARAYRDADPPARLAACVDVLKTERTAAALVATASVCMEVNDLDAARRDLEEAVRLAPDWAAAHYERGKLGLRSEDMERAAASFGRAAELQPGFVPSWANFGAALGELDRPAEALAAFERALAIEPANAQALNNVGVVRRELGRLAESEAAFRQVIQLMPAMAFGHYNLGHTLFLQGRFRAALLAYSEGQARDAERNPVQASRLALCKVATGDASGALAELQRAAAELPQQYRQQVLGETSAVLWALITQHPEVSGWQPIHAWLTKELKG